MSVQIISENGTPQYAVLSYNDYLVLAEQAEMLEDIQAYDDVKSSLANGEEELIPVSVANALADGENPIKVWREYRRFTQLQVAEKAGISVPYVSQLETGKRNASVKVMKQIASLFDVEIENLL